MKKKRLIILLLILPLIIYNASLSFADFNHSRKFKVLENKNEYLLINDIRSLFDNSNGFQLLDQQGEDITYKFIENNRSLYQREEWVQLLDNYYRDVSSMKYFDTNRLDLAITESKSVIQSFSGNLGSNLIAKTTIRGTIWYDPNTYVVRSVSDTTLVSVINMNQDNNPVDNILTHNLYLNSYKSGTYSGAFSCSYRLIGEHASWLREDFGLFSMTMVITPN